MSDKKSTWRASDRRDLRGKGLALMASICAGSSLQYSSTMLVGSARCRLSNPTNRYLRLDTDWPQNGSEGAMVGHLLRRQKRWPALVTSYWRRA